MNTLPLFLFALIFCHLISSNDSTSTANRRSRKSSPARRQRKPRQEREKTNKLKQGGGEEKFASQAFGFLSGGLSVNERTGSHTFEIPLSSITLHHRRLPVKLRYDDFNAVPKQGFFWLSDGWNVALPYLLFAEDNDARPLYTLVLGDGSYYQLNLPFTGLPDPGTTGLHYYQRRNVRVETDGFDFILTKDGDKYYFTIHRAYLYKMVTREGYTLTVDMPSSHRLEVRNETDVVLSMQLDEPTKNIHIRSETSLGTVYYEAHREMFWVTCRSCSADANFTYEFEYDFNGKITQVRYPTGNVERVSHECIYLPSLRQCGGQFRVTSITRFPGTNVLLRGVPQYDGPVMVTTYNYKSPYVNPAEPHHPNFIGQPLALALVRIGEDRLMEAPTQDSSPVGQFVLRRANYSYFVTVSDGYSCKRHEYNKMHLKVETLEGHCNQTARDSIDLDRVLKTTRHTYPCASDIGYSLMAAECHDFVVFDKPIEISVTMHGGENSFTRTTTYQYNKLGEGVYSKTADGQMTNTTFDGSLENGAFRYATEIVTSPAFDADRLATLVSRFKYTNISKFADHANGRSVYAVKTVESKHFRLAGESDVQLIKKSEFSYYNGSELAEPLSHGLAATELQSAPGSESLKIDLSYSFSAAKVDIIVRKSGANGATMTTSTLTDAATGIVLRTVLFDRNVITRKYDSLARLVLLSHQSADEPPKNVDLTAAYTLAKGRNQVQVTLPNGRVIAHLFDNAGRRLERQAIDVDGTVLPTEALLYDEWGRVRQSINFAVKRTGSGRRSVGSTGWHMDSMQRQNRLTVFDPLGRIINSTDASGVESRTIYGSLQDGDMVVNYRVSQRSGKTCCGNCKVTNAAELAIRSGKLLSNFAAVERHRCDETDTLSFTETTYDGYSRVSMQKIWATRKRQLKSITAVTYAPSGHKSAEMIGNEDVWESNVTYVNDNRTGKVTAVIVADREIARRSFDSFGRVQTISLQPVEMRNYYNEFDQLKQQTVNSHTLQLTYDGFGRLSNSEASIAALGKVATQYSYDVIGRPVQIMSKTVDSDNKVSAQSWKQYKYDSLMSKLDEHVLRLSSGDVAIPGQQNKKKMSWKHDSSGRIVESVDFNGLRTAYTYDANSTRLSAQETSINETTAQSMLFLYNDFGMPEVVYVHNFKLSTEIVSRLYYDSYQRVNTIGISRRVNASAKWAYIGLLWYTYDNFGRIVKKSTPSTSESYQYDTLGQLIMFKCTQSNQDKSQLIYKSQCPPFYSDLDKLDASKHVKEQRFTYDNGMRHLTKTKLISNTGNVYQINRVFHTDRPMELLEIISNLDGTVTKYHVKYDDQGSIVGIDRGSVKKYYQFAYDALRRPTLLNAYLLGNSSIRKAYDESGNQFLEQCNAENRSRLLYYSEIGKLVATTDSDSHCNCSYVAVLEKITSRICSNESGTEELLLDAMGSKFGSIDATGAISYNAYTPFGDGLRANQSVLPDIGFQNLLSDKLRLLVTKNGRHYAPFLYQFLQRDPLSPFDGAGINPYSYASNSPIQLGDPSGNVFRALGRFVARLAMRGRTSRLSSLASSTSSMATRSTSLDSLSSLGGQSGSGSSSSFTAFSRQRAGKLSSSFDYETATAQTPSSMTTASSRGVYPSQTYGPGVAKTAAGDAGHCVTWAFDEAVLEATAGKAFTIDTNVLRTMATKKILPATGASVYGTMAADVATAFEDFTMNAFSMTDFETVAGTAGEFSAVTNEEVMDLLDKQPGKPGIIFTMSECLLLFLFFAHTILTHPRGNQFRAMKVAGQGMEDVEVGDLQRTQMGHAVYYSRVSQTALPPPPPQMQLGQGLAGGEASTMSYFPTQQALQQPANSTHAPTTVVDYNMTVDEF